MTQQHPPGATLHLGGDAWAHPDLKRQLVIHTGEHAGTDDTRVPLTTYPGNPRRGDQDAITASIRELGLYRAIIVQRNTGHVLAGNHTLRALLDLGAERVPVTWVDVDDTRAAAIVARDNHTSELGSYDDAELLALLTSHEDVLALSGYADDDLEALRRAGDANAYVAPGESPSLSDRFLVPPFTVLDARGGAWQDRKRRWLSLGIQSEVGRGDGSTLDGKDAARYGRTIRSAERSHSRKPGRAFTSDGSLDRIRPGAEQGRTLAQGLQAHRDPETGELVYTETTAAGVSIFDPVLTELAYRWFSPPTGHVLDPFAGGSVRGIVAGALGRTYTGVELRGEQVEANRAQAGILDPYPTAGAVAWVEGDSLTTLPTLDDQPADLVFSCPPYADLEVYSDDPADLSAMPYDDFLTAYRGIIAAACARLRDDRFAVWVIGDVRDRRGLYRGLVPDTIAAFRDAGLAYYNEAVLVTPVGSLPIRAGRQFAAGRKLGKTHQNVLVFCKGDPKAATEACGTVDVVWPEAEEPSP